MCFKAGYGLRGQGKRMWLLLAGGGCLLCVYEQNQQEPRPIWLLGCGDVATITVPISSPACTSLALLALLLPGRRWQKNSEEVPNQWLWIEQHTHTAVQLPLPCSHGRWVWTTCLQWRTPCLQSISVAISICSAYTTAVFEGDISNHYERGKFVCYSILCILMFVIGICSKNWKSNQSDFHNKGPRLTHTPAAVNLCLLQCGWTTSKCFY